MRTHKIAFLGLFATALAAGRAWGDTAPGPFTDTPPASTPVSSAAVSGTAGKAAAPSVTPPAPSDKPSAKSPAKKPGRDPAESAFRLPRGMILNKKQQAAFDELKAKYEKTLHEALDLLASKDPKDKTKGLKLNRDTRAAIRAGIKDIVGNSSSSGQQPTSSSGQGTGGQSGSNGYSAGYAPQGGYSGNYGPPAGGGYPMSGGGMMRGGCRGR